MVTTPTSGSIEARSLDSDADHVSVGERFQEKQLPQEPLSWRARPR